LISLLIGFVFLREPSHIKPISLGIQEEISSSRALVAQASLRGIVMRASESRSLTSQR
jgi:hypothetical protein